MKKVLLYIILIILFVYLYNSFYSNPPLFLKKKVAEEFFNDDPDFYFRNLTDIELKSMKYPPGEEGINMYIKDSIDCLDEWNNDEKDILRKHCKKADQFLKNVSMEHFPNRLVANIKWRLVKVYGNKYEGAHPHTRMDMIFIPEDILKNENELTRYLVHEKCHVFSRLYPAHMAVWIKENGFKIYKRLDEYPLRRNNPDVDGWVYIDPQGRETVALFTSINPDRFEDVIYPGGFDRHETEHPNETLAYLLDSKVNDYFN